MSGSLFGPNPPFTLNAWPRDERGDLRVHHEDAGSYKPPPPRPPGPDNDLKPGQNYSEVSSSSFQKAIFTPTRPAPPTTTGGLCNWLPSLDNDGYDILGAFRDDVELEEKK